MFLTKSRPCGTVVSRPNSFNDELLRQFFNPSLGSYHGSSPATNIKETDKEFLIELVVPGIPKENFTLKVEKQTLIVSAEVTGESKKENVRLVRHEFEAQKFQKSFVLPEVADTERIAAHHVHGVLHISVPKKEKSASKDVKNIVVN
jgi:HSP20 family protein